MSIDLLLCAKPPHGEQVTSALARRADTRVGLVALHPVDPDDPALAGLDPGLVHSLRAAAEAHGPAVRRQLRGAPPRTRLRVHLEHDPWVCRMRAQGAALVPLDRPARRALRQLADGVPAGPAEPWRARADALGAEVNQALAAGKEPAALAAYLREELAVAETLAAREQHDDAAWSVTEALRVAFHPVLHFDRLTSPLAADPAGFLTPWTSSPVALRITPPTPPRPAPQSRSAEGTTRVAVLTRANADFVPEIVDYLGSGPRYDVRPRDVGGDADLAPLARTPEPLVTSRLAQGDRPAGYAGTGRDAPGDAAAEEERDTEPPAETAARVLGPLVADRDVVWVDWWGALAALLAESRTTGGIPAGVRVVVRCHSFELFTAWPQLTDLSGIDDLVFVSEHLRDLALAVVPGLRAPAAPRLHVRTLAMDLRRCVRPKPADARFTLGVVGASKVVKDPRWAVEVLRRLRRHDPRYRLLLVRGRLQAEHSPATRCYADAVAADLDELGDAVTVTRHTEDVPALLQQVGVVLSSSVRESFHIGLVEGAASGAIPVVRDWPFFPGAAAGIFPPEWVVPDPAAAAERILALTTDDDTWRAAGEEASRRVVQDWDWSVVQATYDDLLCSGG